MLGLSSAPSVPLAFLAGLVSVLSPCVFPLMPAYAAYLSGRASRRAYAVADGLTLDQRAQHVPVVVNGVAFVTGFSLVFIAVYYVLQVLDVTVFIRNLTLVDAIAGAIIVVLALQTLGLLRLGFLMRERRIQMTPAYGAPGAFLLGITFAAGWTPCLGPQLAAILTVAQNRDFGGLPFMVVYCVGLALPFLALAVLADRLQGLMRAVNRRLGVINLVCGAILLGFGLLLATGRITLLSTYSFQSPFNL
ncbi:MAG: cytochrome c biogenesis protein CcdA [Candidatus Dormibacteraeota bacterium]|nr:cytochrome c biogenesis protein CcdA [Candidatus Dormibacteraeota bacterium]